MLKSSFSFGLIAIVAFLISCDPKEENEPTIQVENEINEFVWGGLNSWYFYQGDVAELGDNYFENVDERNSFLNTFQTPEALFESLRHPNDRFSYITDDYNELNQSRQGISQSFGYNFGLVLLGNGDDILGYVRYVLPGTPAAEAGLVRGNIFTEVNGQQLNRDNYIDLLFNNTTYTLGLASIVDSQVSTTGEEVTMTAETITENPVFLTKVLDAGDGTKVGYILYNSFRSTFHSELNNAFGELTSQGVDEFVLDLRYNGGGSVYTAMHLAGMIYGDATEDDVFGKFLHNEKKSNQNIVFPFLTSVDVVDADFNTITTESMNRLNIPRIYVLTSSSTASASELIINGLNPYMEVILIGGTTVGKNEGSVTLYDAPGSDWRDEDQANPDHTYAMQPIINRLSNVNDFTEYTEGFAPDVAVNEINFLENLPPLGDPADPLLAAALQEITGLPARLSMKATTPWAELIDQSTRNDPMNGVNLLDGALDPFELR
jgi:C-terminal processing protease CtpA/Prc